MLVTNYTSGLSCSEGPGFTFLIHSAHPQTRPVVFIIFTQTSVRTSVPTFQNIANYNKRRLKIMITTGGTVGLAEGIIDDTCLVVIHSWTDTMFER